MKNEVFNFKDENSFQKFWQSKGFLTIEKQLASILRIVLFLKPGLRSLLFSGSGSWIFSKRLRLPIFFPKRLRLGSGSWYFFSSGSCSQGDKNMLLIAAPSLDTWASFYKLLIKNCKKYKTSKIFFVTIKLFTWRIVTNVQFHFFYLLGAGTGAAYFWGLLSPALYHT